jgi:Family of unknown function (DUF6519)
MHAKQFDHEPRGEFRGDFSRDTYDPFRHFSRVLMQQGRVQLDADWNEQVSIFWHYLRGLARHIGSEHWGPLSNGVRGFKIAQNAGKDDLEIGPGAYYVMGTLCENRDRELLYSQQYGYPFPDSIAIEDIQGGIGYLAYLDVWERHLTYVEDDYVREVALGGPDTASRAKIVWQVKLKEIRDMTNVDFKNDYRFFLKELGESRKPGSGLLRARAKKGEDQSDPCLVAPESSYRGAENQLYRVEIHQGGRAGEATFKWSRENGAAVFPVREIAGSLITLEHLGRDSRFGLNPDDWVEIVDDHYALKGKALPLLQVEGIDHENMAVTLKTTPALDVDGIEDRHPYLRRWDHTADADDWAVRVVESNGEENEDWMLLEDGVQVQFPGTGEAAVPPMYNTGDYWIIPARTATGDVQWPQEEQNAGDGPLPGRLSPHGVIHYYAPLAIVAVDANGDISPIPPNGDMRRKLKKLWS